MNFTTGASAERERMERGPSRIAEGRTEGLDITELWKVVEMMHVGAKEERRRHKMLEGKMADMVLTQ